jgi:hypothetical protein
MRQAIVLALAMLALGSAGAAAADLGPVGGAVEKAQSPPVGPVGGAYSEASIACKLQVSVVATLPGVGACSPVKNTQKVVRIVLPWVANCTGAAAAGGVVELVGEWAKNKRFPLKQAKRFAPKARKAGVVGCLAAAFLPWIERYNDWVEANTGGRSAWTSTRSAPL